MMLQTRRRALGLLLAAGAGLRPPVMPRALAAKKDCFESKAFGPWKAQATNSQAGARINEVQFIAACDDLRVEIQVAASFDAKIVVYGDADTMPLPRKFLIKPENRLIVRDETGKEAVNEPLCGNCTDIFDDKVSIVLPLATAPFFRDAKSCEIAIKLIDKDECRFKVDCESLRAALAWASERKVALAALAADQKCEPPEGCFITTACCETLGLADDSSSCAHCAATATKCSPSSPVADKRSLPTIGSRRRSWRGFPLRRANGASAPSMRATSCLLRSPQDSVSTCSPTVFM
jgi:hypothetical protein